MLFVTLSIFNVKVYWVDFLKKEKKLQKKHFFIKCCILCLKWLWEKTFCGWFTLWRHFVIHSIQLASQLIVFVSQISHLINTWLLFSNFFFGIVKMFQKKYFFILIKINLNSKSSKKNNIKKQLRLNHRKSKEWI